MKSGIAKVVLASLICFTGISHAGSRFWSGFLTEENQDADFSSEADENDKKKSRAEDCGSGPKSMRITARHIEGRGVGYTQGYSTLEMFLAPPASVDKSFLPFLDLRGHIFNKGKPAANAGFGLRFIGNHIFGINA